MPAVPSLENIHPFSLPLASRQCCRLSQLTLEAPMSLYIIFFNLYSSLLISGSIDYALWNGFICILVVLCSCKILWKALCTNCARYIKLPWNLPCLQKLSWQSIVFSRQIMRSKSQGCLTFDATHEVRCPITVNHLIPTAADASYRTKSQCCGTKWISFTNRIKWRSRMNVAVGLL